MTDLAPLVVLLCVPERAISGRLYRELSDSVRVRRVVEVEDVAKAYDRMSEWDFGLVVVDSVARGAMATGGLVARARERGAVVALLRDAATSTGLNGAVQWPGREGFLTLDRRTPDDLLPEVVDTVLRSAQAARVSGAGPQAAEVTTGTGPDTPAAPGTPTRTANEGPSAAVAPSAPVARTVFLSYRFAEEPGYVQGLRLLLRERGFEVVTGRGAEGSVSAAVLRRIRQSDKFLALMTRHRPIAEPAGAWTTSSWLIEEKGAALAFGKHIVLLVEEGILDIGGLQGDWQRNVFTPQTFTAVAHEAVRQLLSDGHDPQ